MSEQIGLTGGEWITIIGLLTTLITVAGGVIISIINAWKSELNSKMAIIQHSVDGTASRQDAKLTAALEKLDFVEKQVTKEELKSAVLTEALSQSSPMSKGEQGHVPVVIEKNKDK